ncbi:hypothetical protein OROHE_025816 [Orobanche hederae]
MGEQNRENSLQFSPLAINWIANDAAYGLHGERYANHCFVTPGSYKTHQEPVLVPQWMHYQQTPQNYVDFLAERGYLEMQKQMSYDISSQVPSLGLSDPSQLVSQEEHQGHVGNFIKTFTGLEPQYGIEKENWNQESSHAFQVYSGSGTAAPKCTSEARRKRSREKAYAADRCRRLRISYWLDALKEMVPHPKKGGKAALLDNVTDHVKYLQNQVKKSLVKVDWEGHGHYVLQDQMLKGPLEQIMGKLIDVYPSAATELLQKKGLIMMPVTFSEGLLEPVQMLDMQGLWGKGALLNPK